MTTDATVRTGTAPARAEPVPIIQRAGRVLLAAGAFGVVGQLLFFDVGLGINFPIAIGLFLAGGWLLRRIAARIDRRDAWLAPAASRWPPSPPFARIRHRGPRRPDGDRARRRRPGQLQWPLRHAAPVHGLISLALGLIAWVGRRRVLGVSSAAPSPASGRGSRGAPRPRLPVLRGLLIAIPIASSSWRSSPPRMRSSPGWSSDLLGFELDLGDAAWRLALAAVLAWIAAGASGSPPPSAGSPWPERGASSWRIGSTEVVTVLLVVNGSSSSSSVCRPPICSEGWTRSQASGLSYAEYARRGFASSSSSRFLAGSLVIGADRLARAERSAS